MNNQEAYNLLKSLKENIIDAAKDFLKIFKLPETDYEHFRYRIRDLISQRIRSRKNGKLDGWNGISFLSQSEFQNIDQLRRSECSISSYQAIIDDKIVFIEEKFLKSRKHIYNISNVSLKHRISILQDDIDFIAERESFTAKHIAAMSSSLLAIKIMIEKPLNFARKSLKVGHFPKRTTNYNFIKQQH